MTGTPTGEVDLRERATVTLGVKGFVSLLLVVMVTAFGSGGAWVALSMRLTSTQERVSATVVRVSHLEQTSADRAVQLQRLEDGVAHIRETTDQIAEDLRAEKRRSRR